MEPEHETQEETLCDRCVGIFVRLMTSSMERAAAESEERIRKSSERLRAAMDRLPTNPEDDGA